MTNLSMQEFIGMLRQSKFTIQLTLNEDSARYLEMLFWFS